ncbi:hypothetical protein ACLOJK_013433 [Asimina triloba]
MVSATEMPTYVTGQRRDARNNSLGRRRGRVPTTAQSIDAPNTIFPAHSAIFIDWISSLPIHVLTFMRKRRTLSFPEAACLQKKLAPKA